MRRRDMTAGTLPAEMEPFFAVDPVHAFVIDGKALPTKQNVNPPVAVPNPDRCDVPDALAKHHPVLANRPVAVNRASERNYSTGPPLADPEARLQIHRQASLLGGP
jgi:hypothetical protein